MRGGAGGKGKGTRPRLPAECTEVTPGCNGASVARSSPRSRAPASQYLLTSAFADRWPLPARKQSAPIKRERLVCITQSSSLSAFTQEDSHSWLLSSLLFLRGRVEESNQQTEAECVSRSLSKFLSNSQKHYGWGRQECRLYIPRGHFVTKLTAIYFSNVSTSESKILQLARQKQIFTFCFAREKIILLEGKQPFF